MWQVFFVTRCQDRVRNVIGLSHLNAKTEDEARIYARKFGEISTIRMVIRRPNGAGSISGDELTRWLTGGTRGFIIV